MYIFVIPIVEKIYIYKWPFLQYFEIYVVYI